MVDRMIPVFRMQPSLPARMLGDEQDPQRALGLDGQAGVGPAAQATLEDARVDVADLAISSMSGSTSQPNLNSIVAALQKDLSLAGQAGRATGSTTSCGCVNSRTRRTASRSSSRCATSTTSWTCRTARWWTLARPGRCQ